MGGHSQGGFGKKLCLCWKSAFSVDESYWKSVTKTAYLYWKSVFSWIQYIEIQIKNTKIVYGMNG